MNLPLPFPAGAWIPGPAAVPAGSIIAFAGRVSPPAVPDKQPAYSTVVESQGWMVCDGRKLSKDQYGLLYATLGDLYNQGNEAAGEFRIPDYRGYFLRMADMGSGNDPDAGKRKLADGKDSSGVGSVQADAFQTHKHSYQESKGAPVIGGQGGGDAAPMPASDLTGVPTDNPDNVRSSTETRPKNYYIYYLIRFI